MSQFVFLQREWPAVYDAAGRAEAAVHSDPRTACFHARHALELAWAFRRPTRKFAERSVRSCTRKLPR